MLAAGLPDGAVGISGDAVQITDAEISLLNADDSLVDTGTLPNPFRVTTRATIPPSSGGRPGTGVALVEVIPSAYRTLLADQAAAGSTIRAVIQLGASTVGGERVDPEPFRHPIALCAGCLNHCASDLTPQQIDALTSGQCVDNAGADGRVCIDEGC